MLFFFQGLDLAAKPTAKGGLAGSLASQTAVRKRLSRKSPGPELRKPLRNIPPPANVVGPETVSKLLPLFSLHYVFHSLIAVFDKILIKNSCFLKIYKKKNKKNNNFLHDFRHRSPGQVKYFVGFIPI